MSSVAPPAAVRVVPVPRTEPPHDDELASLGFAPPPISAPLLPLELPTRTRAQASDMPAAGDGGRALGSGRNGSAGKSRTRERTGDHAGESHRVGERPGPSARVPVAQIGAGGGSGTGIAAAVGTGSGSGAEAEGATFALPAPPPVPVTRLLIFTCLEIQGGYRPIGQLRPLCRPEAFDQIAQRLLSRPVSQQGHPGARAGIPVAARGAVRSCPAPSTTGAVQTTAAGAGAALTRIPSAAPGRASRGTTGPGDRVSVLRVHTCAVSDEVAEITAVLRRRGKVWAMALRVEMLLGRWLCTHLELV